MNGSTLISTHSSLASAAFPNAPVTSGVAPLFLQSCFSKCHDQYYLAFLMTRGTVCYCIEDEDVPRYFQGKTPGVCDAPCAGDASHFCGGLDQYEVYSHVAIGDGELIECFVDAQKICARSWLASAQDRGGRYACFGRLGKQNDDTDLVHLRKHRKVFSMQKHGDRSARCH